MSFGFGGWGNLMVVHSSISCEVVTSASTSRAEDIVLGGGRGAAGQGGDLPAYRRDSYAAVGDAGLRETAATSVGPAHLPGATVVRQDPAEALQQAVSTRLRPGFHRRYVPPPTPSSSISPRVRRPSASSGEDP
jgi:hypothetical protein